MITKFLGRTISHLMSRISGAFLSPWVRIATIFVAEARLAIDGSNLSFTPKPRLKSGWLTRAHRSDLSFRLSAVELIELRRGDIPSPLARYFNIPFTRFAHRAPSSIRQCSFVRRRSDTMPRIRAQSIELREELKEMVSKAA
jgi:hypothetical protein